LRAAASVLLALAAVAAHAQDPARDKPEPEASSEVLTGPQQTPERRLRDRLRRERSPVDLHWEAPDPLGKILRQHLKGPEVDEAGQRRRGALRPWVRDMRRRIPEIAASEGWFSPKVEVELDEERDDAFITVDPGPRTTVGEVKIEFVGDLAGEGEERAARRAAIERAWTLPRGRAFRSADWEVAKTRIAEELVSLDYAAGELAASEARVDADAASATLVLKLDSGPKFTLGDVEIHGLERYPESVVRRIVMHDRGERYSVEKLQELQRTLQSAPWFASVVVEVERDRGKPDNVPVTMTVVERPTRDLGLSVGYGTDNGARAEIAFRDRDLLNRGFDLQSSLRVSQDDQIGYVDVYLPAGLFGTYKGNNLLFKDSVGVLAQHSDVQGLDVRRFAVAGYRHFTFEPFELRAGLSYQVEEKLPSGAEKRITRALAPVAALTWRHVDDPFDPQRGGVLNLQVAAAGKSLASTQDFVKLYAQYTRWFTFTPKDQLIVRGEIGQTIAPSREGIPEDFLFRAGGSRSNRGYAYQSLGPREGDAVVGGRYLVSASADYIHWLDATWGGALFYDVGDATDSSRDWKANQSYGFGVRYKTPAGPLALDLAYADRLKKFRISFSVTVAF
jgi:translocation and assembly module TamA